MLVLLLELVLTCVVVHIISGTCVCVLPRVGAGIYVERSKKVRKTPLFFEFSLCLSRACLGKKMHLYINGSKSGVFRTLFVRSGRGFERGGQREGLLGQWCDCCAAAAGNIDGSGCAEHVRTEARCRVCRLRSAQRYASRHRPDVDCVVHHLRRRRRRRSRRLRFRFLDV